MRQYTFTAEHMVGEREIELAVTYACTRGRPEQGPTYDCGGQPAEPDEIELVSIMHNGELVVLSDAEEEALLEQAIARCIEDLAADAADEGDYRYGQMRDRQMMERWEEGK